MYEKIWFFLMTPIIFLSQMLVKFISFTAPDYYFVQYTVAKLDPETAEALAEALEELEDDE